MRWMLCCVWLACCSLDTSSSTSGTSSKEGAPKAQWTPRDTASGRTATAASDLQDASTAAAASPKESDAGQRATSAKDKPKSSMSPAMDAAVPARMSAPTHDAGAVPSTPTTMLDSSAPSMPFMTSSTALDAGTSAPRSQPDAAAADGGDAAQVDNILVWFALTGTRQQRVLMAALIADLEGRRAIDEDGMISVLRNFDELQCRRNVQLCWEVCVWATSRCHVCEGRECQRLMYQHCGSDCRGDNP